jgi:hypothetical protein
MGGQIITIPVKIFDEDKSLTDRSYRILKHYIQIIRVPVILYDDNLPNSRRSFYSKSKV